jgi:hypothetical protein
VAAAAAATFVVVSFSVLLPLVMYLHYTKNLGLKVMRLKDIYAIDYNVLIVTTFVFRGIIFSLACAVSIFFPLPQVLPTESKDSLKTTGCNCFF